MKVLLPLCISMVLFFIEQNYSWRMYAITVFSCILIGIMPKNIFTKDLRQPPSTWEKWE
jgi:hypothetical protein